MVLICGNVAEAGCLRAGHERWPQGTSDRPHGHHPLTATLPAAAGIVSGTPRPNVGKHPFTGWRRRDDHGYLLCVTKRMAVTLEHDGGKHVRDIRRSECGRIA